MKRRVVRIWPMYALATLCVVFLSWMVANGVFSNVGPDFAYHYNANYLNPAWIFNSLTFTHGYKAPVLGTGWTLQVEFMFYSAFALILLSRPISLARLELSLLAFFLLASAISASGAEMAGFFKSFANPMMIEFAFGMFMYRCYSHGWFGGLWVSTTAIALGAVAFIFLEISSMITWPSTFYRPVVWGGCAALIVWGSLGLEGVIPRSKFFLLLGDSSYSLYLTHYLIAPIAVHYSMNNSLSSVVPIWIYLSGFIVICHAVAVATHVYIEKPVTRFVRGVFEKRTGSSQLRPAS